MIHGTPNDTVWLAGLLEGEGSFDSHRGRYPRIRLAMTDRDIVGRAASLMDTTIRLSLHRAPSKPTWHTEVSGERAASIMRAILPHMGARRSGKIAETLAVHELRREPERAHFPGPAVSRPLGIAKPATAA